MKVNLFKLNKEMVANLITELEADQYEGVADYNSSKFSTKLYLKKKRSKNQGWIEYYQNMVDKVTFSRYASGVGSEHLSGVFCLKHRTMFMQ